jgi:hypothetical protein
VLFRPPLDESFAIRDFSGRFFESSEKSATV